MKTILYFLHDTLPSTGLSEGTYAVLIPTFHRDVTN
jgi:hypothetical protein